MSYCSLCSSFSVRLLTLVKALAQLAYAKLGRTDCRPKGFFGSSSGGESPPLYTHSVDAPFLIKSLT